MNDKQKQLAAILGITVAVVALGVELFVQYQKTLPRGPMAPPNVTGNKGAWVRAKKEGKNPDAVDSGTGTDRGPAAR